MLNARARCLSLSLSSSATYILVGYAAATVGCTTHHRLPPLPEPFHAAGVRACVCRLKEANSLSLLGDCSSVAAAAADARCEISAARIRILFPVWRWDGVGERVRKEDTSRGGVSSSSECMAARTHNFIMHILQR